MTSFSNPDLHSHSIFSDGTLSPEEVAARAKAGGVDLWALTDHDGVGGQARAQAAAQELGLAYLSGVEISITWANTTVHIVGLGFDTSDRELVAGLDATRSGRQERAREMGARLEQHTGLSGVYQGALEYAAGNPQAIARPHFARYLVDQGACSSVADAFRKYLADDKPGFVPHRWASLTQAVHWIRSAGGVAVIAHPARYRFTAQQEEALFSEFTDLGGQAVEVVTGSHTAAEAREYARIARRFKLAASRGSDFHAPAEGRPSLGQMAPLPEDLNPVWDLLAPSIQHPPRVH